MEKYRAIPEGYMTVGQLAKKMGTTVRTLQYYDKEGLLSPSAESDGGRRLYTNKDMIQLYQILTLKSVGFSLDDIKNHLISLDSPEDVAKALTVQADDIRTKIKDLSASLTELEGLKNEVLQMQSVDFKKYSDIIVNLQMNNQFYRLIKHFDDDTLDYFRELFDKDSSELMLKKTNDLFNLAATYAKDGIDPKSEQGQHFAKEFWDMVNVFTGGNPALLENLMNTYDTADPDTEWSKHQQAAIDFIGASLGVYFDELNINPLADIESHE